VTETEWTFDKKCYTVYKVKCTDGYDTGKVKSCILSSSFSFLRCFASPRRPVLPSCNCVTNDAGTVWSHASLHPRTRGHAMSPRADADCTHNRPSCHLCSPDTQAMSGYMIQDTVGGVVPGHRDCHDESPPSHKQ
jgi:hypothetical protein